MSAVNGKKLIYKYRLLSKASQEAAFAISYVTENGRSIEIDGGDSTATKDGTIRSAGTPAIEITSNSILKKGDPRIEELEDALLSGELLEIWEANLDEPVQSKTDKYNGKYYQGYLTSFDKSSPSDDYVSIDLTFGINGKGAKGEVTVTASEVEEAQYVFKDTTKASA